MLKSGEDEKERIILMKSRGLRHFLLVRDPAVTTVIYLAKLIQTDLELGLVTLLRLAVVGYVVGFEVG